MSDMLSEAAQAMIDAHRAQQQSAAEPSIDALLDDGRSEADRSGAAAGARAFVRKPQYTAAAMVDLMVEHPEYSHAQFAAHFGYKPSWFAGVLISRNFQMVLESRRSEVINPMLTGTMDDMFRALTLQSLTVLQQRIEDPRASEDLILKAAALGVKALGMGTAGGMAPPPQAPKTLQQLALEMSQPQVAVGRSRDYTIEASLEELPR